MNFSKLTFTNKLTLFCTFLATFSLFLPWRNAGFHSSNGFQEQAYLLLITFIYPVFIIFNDNKANHNISLISLLLGFIFSLFFKSNLQTNYAVTNVDLAGIGFYIMFLALSIAIITSIISIYEFNNKIHKKLA